MMIRPLIKEDIEVAHKLLSRAFNMAAKRTRQDLQEWLTCPDEVIGRIAVVGDRFACIVMTRRYEECDGLTISPYCLAVLESFW